MAKFNLLVEVVGEKKISPPTSTPNYFLIFINSFAAIFLSAWILLLFSEFSLYFLIDCYKPTCSSFSIFPAMYVKNFSKILGAEILSNQFGFSLSNSASLSEKIFRSRIAINSLTQKSLPVLHMLLGNGPVITSQQISSISLAVSNLNDKLAYILGDLTQVSKKDPLYSRLLFTEKEITNQKNTISKSSQLMADLPLLLSLNKKSTYAILFQDNAENRGTGGFIDSLGILSIENGKISSLDLYDSFSLDAQLRGHVDPPASLISATGENNWYLRDANWGVSFPQVATKVAWFIQKETNINPDLVIAINLNTIAILQKIIDPKATQSVFFDKYLIYLKNNSSNSSYILSVLQDIQTKTTILSASQITNLVSLLATNLQNREIFIYPTTFQAPSLSVLGWSGEVAPVVCRSSFFCLSDYHYSQDNNIGVNKVSPYITKTTNLKINFDNTNLHTSTTTIFKNQNTDSSWPLGMFKNYLRYYLPRSVILDTVYVDQKVVSNTGYQLTQESGFTVLSLPVSVSPSSKKEVVVNYHQPTPQEIRYHYQLDLPNQPGNLNDIINISINYPPNWYVFSNNKFLLASRGHLSYNALHSGYEKIDLDLVPTK